MSFLILAILLIGIIRIPLIKDVEIVGSERYTIDDLEKYVFNSYLKKNTLYLYIFNKFNNSYNIPYIKKLDIEIKSYNKVRVIIDEYEIPYQIKVDNDIYDVNDNFLIQGISNRDESKLLFEVSVTNADYSTSIIDNDELKSAIKLITNKLDEANIKEFNKIEIKENEITLYSKLHTILLGKVTNMNEKLANLSSIYKQIKNEAGTLYLNEYKSDGSGYRFKKKLIN